MARLVLVLASAALLTAFAVVIADVIQHSHSGGPLLRSIFAWWLMAGPGTLSAAQGVVEASLGAAFWDVAETTILAIPAVFVLTLAAVFLFSMSIAVRSP